MQEGCGAIVDFAHVLSISDPVVRSVLDSDLAERLGDVPYRKFHLTPRILVMLFDRATSPAIVDALRSMERDLEVSHSGTIEWTVYDLHTEMQRFRADSKAAVELAHATGQDQSAFRPESDRLGALLHTIDAMRIIDIATHVREQVAVRIDGEGKATAAFEEIWVDLEDIEQSIGLSIRNDPWKFAHITDFLDFRVLDHVTRSWSGQSDVSLNLHCASAMQAQFDNLIARVPSHARERMIFELSLSEFMDNPKRYQEAVDKLRGAGFRVAADSAVWPILEKISGRFPNVQFVKVPWTDAFADLAHDQRERVKKLIAAAPAVDFVLNRCGRAEDLEVGQKLGFSVFQGWGVPAPTAAAPVGESA